MVQCVTTATTYDPMRVIAGTQKGRRLAGPTVRGIRPTSDKVKEALFSIVRPWITDALFVDLYAGTGAIGIEALSRGARRGIFVEPNPAARRLLRLNLEQCGLNRAAEIYGGTAEAFLRRAVASSEPYDIVFADPPYHTGGIKSLVTALEGCPCITPSTTVVLEHFSKLMPPSALGLLSRLRQYRYGDTTLSLFGSNPQAMQSP